MRAARTLTVEGITGAPRTVLAIDPGPTYSAYVFLEGDRLVAFDRWPNHTLVGDMRETGGPYGSRPDAVVIEKVEGYGMPVGAEVFETVFWAGRMAEAAHPLPVHRIGRKAVKVHLCGTTKAKDPNVRQALIDRYGGKDTAIGRKAAPGPLYGVSGDVWAALAVAVTFHDQEEAI